MQKEAADGTLSWALGPGAGTATETQPQPHPEATGRDLPPAALQPTSGPRWSSPPTSRGR